MRKAAACNAVETLLVHPSAVLRGCHRCLERFPDLLSATDITWDMEFGDQMMSIKIVEDLDEVVARIPGHGSGHTEAIIAEHTATAPGSLPRWAR